MSYVFFPCIIFDVTSKNVLLVKVWVGSVWDIVGVVGMIDRILGLGLCLGLRKILFPYLENSIRVS